MVSASQRLGLPLIACFRPYPAYRGLVSPRWIPKGLSSHWPLRLSPIRIGLEAVRQPPKLQLLRLRREPAGEFPEATARLDAGRSLSAAAPQICRTRSPSSLHLPSPSPSLPPTPIRHRVKEEISQQLHLFHSSSFSLTFPPVFEVAGLSTSPFLSVHNERPCRSLARSLRCRGSAGRL